MVSIRQACIHIIGIPTPNKIHPKNTVDAQFSIYCQVSVAWLYGSDVGWAAYDKLDDPNVSLLSDRITVTADENIGGLETKFVVKYTVGTCKTKSLLRPLGEDSNPFTKDRVDQKFFSLASPIYGQEVAHQIRDIVDNVEDTDIGKLMVLVK